MKTILFACVHNAGRSQMAAALFNRMVVEGEARAISAGTQPADRVHPKVVAVMGEIGVELGASRPQLLTAELARSADLLVTMGCGEQCPAVGGIRRQDWRISDPKGLALEQVRCIRDQIAARIEQLITNERFRRRDQKR